MHSLLLSLLLFTQPSTDSIRTGAAEYLVRHYDIEDGLPVNSVNGMVQDNDGYLYFSTYDGLVRYDGYEFKVYNSGNTEGLAINRIAGILKSQDNSIWLFNEDQSITLKSGNSFRTFLSPEIPGKAHRIIEGTDGQIWVSGMEGVAFFNKKESVLKKIEAPLLQSNSELIGAGINGGIFVLNDSGLVSFKNNIPSLLLNVVDYPILDLDIRQIKQFEESTVWLVGVGAILRYNTETKEVALISVPEEGTGIAFWDIAEQTNGDYILSATNGLYTLNPLTLIIQKLPVSINSGIVRSNLIYTGGAGEEILIGDDEVIIEGKTILRAPSLKFGFNDREGSLWIGSETNGLYQIRKSSFINLSSSEIPGLNNIYSIIQDRSGSYWACGISSGIVRISKSGVTNWNSSNSTLRSNLCKFLYEDDDGDVYAGLSDHLIWKFTNGNWLEPEDFGGLPSDKLVDPEAMHRLGRNLLIGNYQSMLISGNGSLRYFDDSQPQELARIQVFAENSKNIIFVGTAGTGLSRIEGNSFINYSTKDGVLNSNIIRDIFLQSDDTLWIATENLGLNRLVLNEKGTVLSSASITTSEGLTHNSLHRIIEDPFGNFWISSNGGIMRIPKKALNDFADGSLTKLPVLSFDERDGMINREANGGVQSAGILTSDNKLWFPNQRGITIIDPADFTVEQNLDTPTPVLESVELENGELFVAGQPEIAIPSGERNLRINFAAPNFTYQERVQFSYKLQGVNNSWQSADQSKQAVFTGIPPGAHTFTVRADFIGGEPVETSALIMIPHFFYETRWFALLIVFSGIGLVIGFFRIRVRSLKEREAKLQVRVDEQTEALKLAAEQKNRFFTGITHELKTPLSLIVGPLDDILNLKESIDPEKLGHRLSLMQRNGLRLQNLVEQILNVSKLNADAIKLNIQPVDVVMFTQQILGQFQSKMDQEEIILNIKAAPLSENIYIDKEAWERIVINLMSNAIKFSPKGATISLSVEENEEKVTFGISDEGPGIRSEEQGRIFDYLYQVEGAHAAEGTGIGLYLVKGLVEHMGGNIELNSEPSEGAEFVITLPKGYMHIDSMHNISHDSTPENVIIAPRKNTESPSFSVQVASDSEEHIMIVEDNFDFRSYLQSVLSESYRVSVAENGKDALDILKEITPDLVISDVMMPEMTGLEFVRVLRSEDRFKHLPVIFLSAKDQDLDIKTGLSTGADVYLTKPVQTNMLLTQISAILRREKILKTGFVTDAEIEEPNFIKQVREIVFRQLGNPSFNVNQLADALYISRAKLYMDWKEVSDVTVNDFIKKIRFDEAKILLQEKNFNIQETARAVGFSDPNYFSTSFKKEFGFPPSELTK
ncbi:response regulator [Gracilimonas sp.]|uniref:response regulator n=1 Tax=Gracilimonas sp. TaxID=1974203 RepID=UPI003D15026F